MRVGKVGSATGVSCVLHCLWMMNRASFSAGDSCLVGEILDCRVVRGEKGQGEGGKERKFEREPGGIYASPRQVLRRR